MLQGKDLCTCHGGLVSPNWWPPVVCTRSSALACQSADADTKLFELLQLCLTSRRMFQGTVQGQLPSFPPKTRH